MNGKVTLMMSTIEITEQLKESTYDLLIITSPLINALVRDLENLKPFRLKIVEYT